MPTIQLKYSDRKKKNSSKQNCLNHIAVYNTRTWKELRLYFLAENPLCEICKKLEKITLAQEVHHKIPISTGKTKEEKQQLGFDINNLQALCTECHKNIDKVRHYEYTIK
jgi:5-methylcytosine-specific restriction endonuclease McrA